ncbi:MAG: trypsin-like serine protease, partial [Nannocystaceae bacterium]|nr:trypsin-like serine protease [Nannocystaceae bacterium]
TTVYWGFVCARAGAVWATLGEENEVGERRIGGDGIDTCNGDSGGPALVLLDGLGWRVLGITSYGFTCGEGGWYTQVHRHEAWLAENTVTDQCSYPWDADEGEWEMSCVPVEFQGKDPCALGDSADGCSITGESGFGPVTILTMLLMRLRRRRRRPPRRSFSVSLGRSLRAGLSRPPWRGVFRAGNERDCDGPWAHSSSARASARGRRHR